ncbi:MAG: urease accessory protein UreE [Vicinamibacterales bacterium]
MAFFKSVPVAETVFRADRLPAGLSGHLRDRVVLGWQERLSTRGRWRTEGGVEFGVGLPRGTVLRDGDCLALDQPPLLIAVCEKPEPVLVIVPETPERAATWAYFIGNSHQPLMVVGGVLLCADVTGADQVLAFHGIPFVRDVRPFTPAAVPGHHG